MDILRHAFSSSSSAFGATAEKEEEEETASSSSSSSCLLIGTKEKIKRKEETASSSSSSCLLIGTEEKVKRRLDFSQVYFCGHQTELKQLLESYESVQRNQQAIAVILESPSGTGKTVLLDRFRASVEQQQQQSNSNSSSSNSKSINKKPLVCRGKFEERTAASEPFAAIVEAMNELCDQIIMASSSNSEGEKGGQGLALWQKRIHDDVGDEIVFLQAIFPKMERLLESSDSPLTEPSSCTKSILPSSSRSFHRKQHQHSSSTSHCSSTLPLDFEGFGNLTEKEWRFERFRLAFRSLIRIVSTLHGAPLVLLLDDLHWADPDSLTLLQTLLEDSQRNRQFMLVAATRPNMKPAAVLMRQLDCCPSAHSCHHDSMSSFRDRTATGGSVRTEQLQGNTQIRLIHVENLKPNDIACILLRLFERAQHSQESPQEQYSSSSQEEDYQESPEQHPSSSPLQEKDYQEEDLRANPDVECLANLIFDKTHGNSFAVLQLLRLLEQEQILYYSLEKKQWTWDDNEQVQRELTNCILYSNSHTGTTTATSGDHTGHHHHGGHIVDDDHNAAVVTQIVAKSLQRAPEQQRRALVIASVFGVSHFEVTTIVHAMTLLDNDCRGMSSVGHGASDCDNGVSDNNHCAVGTFMDGNGDVQDEDSLDPFQVQARVRIMNQVLKDAARNGFVTETARGHYKFTHDRIREAAYSLLPPDGSHAKQLLHLRIGRQLRSWMDQSSELGMDQSSELGMTSTTTPTASSSSAAFFTTEESLLLHATKQLNLGANLMTDAWEKLDLAEQNFSAAELAAKKTSFSPAMEYLEQGLDQLGDAPWKDYYALTHKLSVALARIQYSCGRFLDSVETADEILRHGKHFRDKQPVYHTKILCLVQQEQQIQAQELVLDILEELGHKLPRRFLMLHLLFGMRKVGGLLKGMSDHDILHIPKARPPANGHLHDSAEFLVRLAEISFLGGNTLYFPIYAVKVVELSLEQGLFSLSPLALLCWGVIQAKVGKLQEAARFGRLSLAMSQQTHGRQHDTRARVGYYSLMFYWELPLSEGIVPLRQAFKEYWGFGALDYLHLDIAFLNRLIFACGEPLVDIAREFEKTSELLLDYRQQVLWDLNAPIFQAVLNFIGDQGGVDDESEWNPAILLGKYIRNQDDGEDDQEHQFAAWTTTKNNLALFQYQFYSVMVALWFGDVERAETFLSEMQPIFEVSSDFQSLFQVFYSCLVYLALCKRSHKQGRGHWRKYKKMAMTQYQQLLKWAKDGAVTCIHMHLLLYAEKRSAELTFSKSSSANDKDVEQVRQEYDRAIESASVMGLCHHEALANELAGVFLLNIQSNNDDHTEAASVYLFRAVNLYRTWGAAAKVKDLYSRYSNALSSPRESTTSRDESET